MSPRKAPSALIHGLDFELSRERFDCIDISWGDLSYRGTQAD
jgi:hypothetical protein